MKSGRLSSEQEPSRGACAPAVLLIRTRPDAFDPASQLWTKIRSWFEERGAFGFYGAVYGNFDAAVWILGAGAECGHEFMAIELAQSLHSEGSGIRHTETLFVRTDGEHRPTRNDGRMRALANETSGFLLVLARGLASRQQTDVVSPARTFESRSTTLVASAELIGRYDAAFLLHTVSANADTSNNGVRDFARRCADTARLSPLFCVSGQWHFVDFGGADRD